MTTTRRELLLGLLGCAACGAAGSVAGPLGADGAVTKDCTKSSTGGDPGYCLLSPLQVRVTRATGLAVGQAVLVNVDDATAVILARDEQGFFARSAVCTHACCVVALCGDKDCGSLTPSPHACGASAIVRPDPAGGIICPCHGSLFRLSDGVALTGPAKRPLPAYAVTFEGEDAWVDTAMQVDARTRV